MTVMSIWFPDAFLKEQPVDDEIKDDDEVNGYANGRGTTSSSSSSDKQFCKLQE